MESNNQDLDNNLNSKEIFMSILFHKKIILFVLLISISLSAYFIRNADRKYTATALFKIASPASLGALPIGGELGSLAKLAGAKDTQTSALESIEEKVMSRNFVSEMDKIVDFKTDIYFNSYNETAIESPWKRYVKNWLRLSSTKLDKNEISMQLIMQKYKKSITFIITDA